MGPRKLSTLARRRLHRAETRMIKGSLLRAAGERKEQLDDVRTILHKLVCRTITTITKFLARLNRGWPTDSYVPGRIGSIRWNLQFMNRSKVFRGRTRWKRPVGDRQVGSSLFRILGGAYHQPARFFIELCGGVHMRGTLIAFTTAFGSLRSSANVRPLPIGDRIKQLPQNLLTLADVASH